MVVATRASVRRRNTDKSYESLSNTKRSSTASRSPSDPPERSQKRRRRRSSTPLDSIKDESSSAQCSLSTDSVGRGIDLTWQQQELLLQSSIKSHRRSKSTLPSQPTILPILRVTAKGEIVVATACDASRKSRRSLPSPQTLNHTQADLRARRSTPTIAQQASDTASKAKCRLKRQSASATLAAYAEPSCFRSPLPESLPLPCFSRPVKSQTAATTAQFA
ncbi:uncharacterized protein UTRI_01029_B [Ustilago trichophora]|uniref:Uncharacterized protein n=1 Tax=Ustilago trichophora TaxID=86804 RepID=A0A5C3DSX7_9BASI|nr:uncharacterized protein UTRI_01029_B [Ustilago trichophora]